MKNKIEDLRNHLFAQMERLSAEDLTTEQMELESKRTAGIVSIADQLIASAKVEVNYLHTVGGTGSGFLPIERPQLTGK